MNDEQILESVLLEKEELRLQIANLPVMNQKVLDHGYVQYVEHMGSDKSVSRSARVSYNDAARDGDDKLLNYLMKNAHNTPFESSSLTIEVKAPIFVVRQWHRHRTQSYNEVSARYAELPAEFYVPELNQITTQSKDNKQMRTVEEHPQAVNMQNIINARNNDAFNDYQYMLEEGFPRELARSVLPVGTYTKMFATANMLNWYKFLGLRLHPHAQYEIRVYAEAILNIMTELYPIATAAFKQYHMDENHD